MTALSHPTHPEPCSLQTERFIENQLLLISEPFRPNLRNTKQSNASAKENAEQNADKLSIVDSKEPSLKQTDAAVKKINAGLRKRINAFFDTGGKCRVLTEIANVRERRQACRVSSEERSIPLDGFPDDDGSTCVGAEPLAEEMKRSRWLDAYPAEWTSKTGERESEGDRPDMNAKNTEMIHEYENIRARCLILQKSLAAAKQRHAQYRSLRNFLSETSTLAIKANTTEPGSELSKELKRTAALLPKVINVLRKRQEIPKKRNREDADLRDDQEQRIPT